MAPANFLWRTINYMSTNQKEPGKIAKFKGGAIPFFAACLSLFLLYTAGFGLMPNFIQRGIFLGFVLVLCFLSHPSKKQGVNSYYFMLDMIFCFISIFIAFYITYHYDRIIEGPSAATLLDRTLGALLICLITEAARRVLGFKFIILIFLALSYPLFGMYIPGDWGHRGFDLSYVIEHLFMSTEGIWGIIIAIGATIVAIFVIFGAVLDATGGGKSFTSIATYVAGRLTGGAAKIAVFSSALFGMTNGNGPANVATTGVFTIPLMKEKGYAPHFAAAVEATASSGGQIMPPVMGAAAFIMAEMINIPYLKICVAAIFPAILYYIGCWASIHFESCRCNYRGLPKEQIPHLKEVVTPDTIFPLLIPIAVLLYLLIENYTPLTAALRATLTSAFFYLVLTLARKQNLRKAMQHLGTALVAGGKGLVFIGVLCGAAQIIVSMINLTGVGVKLSAMIIGIGENFLFPSLILTMVVVIILGMGLPTAAAYVLAAAVVGPALTKIGVPPLTAHLFILYFSVFSALTPPVCTSVYVASTIAESDWMRTAIMAMKIGIAGFLAPFIFAYAPGIMLQAPPLTCFLQIITATFGIIIMAGGSIGYLYTKTHFTDRILLLLSGLMMIEPTPVFDFIGIAIGSGIYIKQRWWKLRPKKLTL